MRIISARSPPGHGSPPGCATTSGATKAIAPTRRSTPRATAGASISGCACGSPSGAGGPARADQDARGPDAGSPSGISYPARPAFTRVRVERAARGREWCSAYASSSRRIIRWYCVLCLRASSLKNATLRLLNAIVTLTPSSRKTRSSGRGRKSGTIFNLPRRSSVYLTFSLICLLALAPVPGAENSDDVFAIREADRHHPALDPAEAVVSLLARTMGEIFRDHAVRVSERQLGLDERYAVFLLVLVIFLRVPFEPRPRHHRQASMRLAK